jgi:glycosyltransferase involved in cell wall biosynthesis
MRVLIISWEYPPQIEGGLGRHVAELVPALTGQDVELHVVTPVFKLSHTELSATALNNLEAIGSTSKNLTPTATVDIEDGVVVHRVFTLQRQVAVDIYERVLRVNQILEAYVNQVSDRHGPWDLIHVHDWLTGFAGMALKKSQNCPLVATIHATERGRAQGHIHHPLQQSIDNVDHDLIHAADRAIVCSHYMVDELQSFFQVAVSKLDVVPNGVDVSGLRNNHSSQDIEAFRAKYATHDERVVFTVGRLVYEKGFHRLVEATPRILAGCSSARIIIAGRGPEAENLRQQAEELGVAHKVDFVGFISDEDRNQLFKAANCAVFPSLYEPFGIVALEAMALDCPVVVSDVGGFAEVVKHTVTGLTTYPDDAESVAWGVLWTIRHPEWSQKYAVMARQSVTELFNWPRVAALTKTVYEHALESGRNHP